MTEKMDLVKIGTIRRAADGVAVEVAPEYRAGLEGLSEFSHCHVAKTVPACMCLVFTHRGSVARIGESYQAIYRDWLPCSEMRPVLPFNFDRYPAAGADPSADDYVMEICVPVREGSGVTPALPAEARA